MPSRGRPGSTFALTSERISARIVKTERSAWRYRTRARRALRVSFRHYLNGSQNLQRFWLLAPYRALSAFEMPRCRRHPHEPNPVSNSLFTSAWLSTTPLTKPDYRGHSQAREDQRAATVGNARSG